MEVEGGWKLSRGSSILACVLCLWVQSHHCTIVGELLFSGAKGLESRIIKGWVTKTSAVAWLGTWQPLLSTSRLWPGANRGWDLILQEAGNPVLWGQLVPLKDNKTKDPVGHTK